MLLNINFSNLSVEGYAAFILAIIFSIVSFAGFIFFIRHKNLNKTMSTLIALVFPMIAIFCWVYLLFNVFNFSVAIALGVSFACAIGYALIVLAIAFAINHSIKTRETKVENTKTASAEENVDEPVETEEVEENVITPVLTFEGTVSSKDVVEEPIELENETDNEEK